MFVTSELLRSLRLAGAIVLLSVLWASVCSAAPALRARGSPSKICDAQTSIRKLIRQARTLGGPLAKRLRSAGIRLNRQTTMVKQTHRGGVRDDEQAIQNDAPAAQLAVDPRIDLRPLGAFVDSQASPLLTRSPSPRSPRGPPTGA